MMKRIIYIQYANPACYPPLEHSSTILSNNDWKILFVGTSCFGKADILNFPSRPNIISRKLSFYPIGWKRRLYYLWFCLWAILWTIRWRPQWIYASNPLSCPVSLLANFFSMSKIIYHEHDSPTILGKATKFMQFVFWARRKLVRKAEFCILPNDQRAKHFAKEMKSTKKIFTVWNCASRDEAETPSFRKQRKDFWVLYRGSIVPYRLPQTILEALTKVPEEIKLIVIGYETIGYSGYVERLKGLASQLLISHRIQFLGTLPKESVLKHCQDCDVGLVFVPEDSNDINEKYMIGASNKSFEYLASGLPLLVSNLPDWEEIYVKQGYGRACNPNDPEDIALNLKWFFDHLQETREMGERGKQKILTEWNYEKQFEPVLKILSKGEK